MIGGAAGLGIETTAELLEKTFQRAGFYVLSVRDVMSRVRGGHNFISIRFQDTPVYSHSNYFDVIAAFDEETLLAHSDQLAAAKVVLCDKKLQTEAKVYALPFSDLAAELGNKKVVGTVIAGAILKVYDIDVAIASELLPDIMKPDLVEVNQKALQAGYHSIDTLLQVSKPRARAQLILSGNQALGLGAIAAGVNFYSAYPMSPSTSIMEYLASVSEKAHIVVEQAEDEIAAINMALGASYAGARAMTGTSGGGFCLKVEAIGFSGIAEIPLVAVDVMRPGPATGLPTRTEQSDLKFVISAAQGEFQRMVIALRNHEDAVYQTFRAFQLAEKYQIPVIVLSDQYLADSHGTIPPVHFEGETVCYPDLTVTESGYLRYKITDSGISPRLIPGKTKELVCVDSDEHNEKGWIVESAEERIVMADKRERKMLGLMEELMEPEYIGSKDPEVVFLAWGSVYGPLREAVDILNASEEVPKYGGLIFGDVFPLPTKELSRIHQSARKLINVEQNSRGQLAELIRENTGYVMDGSILKYDGRQISAEEIVEKYRMGGLDHE
jgi:2-oxoacid:acceptor oxidoreductase, alpha subunit